MQPLTAQFKTYLAKQTKNRLAPATLKNYVSDAEIFLTWLGRQLQETVIQPIHLTEAMFGGYGRRLNDPDNQVSPATAQRYLSSLKCFGKWLAGSGRCDSDPAAGLSSLRVDPTADRLVREFKNELVRQKLSPSTVKNYVSDVNNYLLWAIQHVKLTEDNLIKL